MKKGTEGKEDASNNSQNVEFQKNDERENQTTYLSMGMEWREGVVLQG